MFSQSKFASASDATSATLTPDAHDALTVFGRDLVFSYCTWTHRLMIVGYIEATAALGHTNRNKAPPGRVTITSRQGGWNLLRRRLTVVFFSHIENILIMFYFYLIGCLMYELEKLMYIRKSWELFIFHGSLEHLKLIQKRPSGGGSSSVTQREEPWLFMFGYSQSFLRNLTWT